MKKSGDFWTGGRCVAWRGYKGSLLRGTALVVVSVRPVTSPRRLSFLLTTTVWFETRALSVRGADAIMKSTRDAAQTARALKLALTPVTQSG